LKGDFLAALRWQLPAAAFVFGAIVGSFLNVVIARVPKGESIVSPGSRCPRCRKPIAWYDNVPIVSWLLLRAKCRNCGLPISARYPLVELLTALLALAVVKRFGFSLPALGFFTFAAALVALAYIDIDTWLLPHQITWPLLGLGLLSPLWNGSPGFPDGAIGAAAGFAVFAAIALVGEKVLKRETMGWGDVWLLAGIGAWLGWRELLPVILLSALQGSVVGIALILVGRDPSAQKDPEPAVPPASTNAPAPAEPPAAAGTLATANSPAMANSDDDWVPPRHAVPYGPFLAIAALEVLLAGPFLQSLWEKLLGKFVS
jgi:leader peptidase (prepilin peptidase)/N-methyltransferase